MCFFALKCATTHSIRFWSKALELKLAFVLLQMHLHPQANQVIFFQIQMIPLSLKGVFPPLINSTKLFWIQG